MSRLACWRTPAGAGRAIFVTVMVSRIKGRRVSGRTGVDLDPLVELAASGLGTVGHNRNRSAAFVTLGVRHYARVNRKNRASRTPAAIHRTGNRFVSIRAHKIAAASVGARAGGPVVREMQLP